MFKGTTPRFSHRTFKKNEWGIKPVDSVVDLEEKLKDEGEQIHPLVKSIINECNL